MNISSHFSGLLYVDLVHALYKVLYGYGLRRWVKNIGSYD